jgi:hypothetical protein
MRRVALALLAVGLLSAFLPQPPARAASSTVCTYELDATITPGTSLHPTKGTWGTAGEAGMIMCGGTVKGQHPTGSGTLRVDASYGASSPDGDTCLGGAGTGRYSFTLPTSEGSVTVEDSITYTYGFVSTPLGAPMTAQWSGAVSSGTGVFVPTAGTCLISPVTAIHISGSGLVPS